MSLLLCHPLFPVFLVIVFALRVLFTPKNINIGALFTSLIVIFLLLAPLRLYNFQETHLMFSYWLQICSILAPLTSLVFVWVVRGGEWGNSNTAEVLFSSLVVAATVSIFFFNSCNMTKLFLGEVVLFSFFILVVSGSRGFVSKVEMSGILILFLISGISAVLFTSSFTSIMVYANSSVILDQQPTFFGLLVCLATLLKLGIPSSFS